VLTVAWLSSTMFTVVSIVAGMKYPIGRHIWDIPLHKFEGIAYVTWLAEFSSLVAGGATKISVLLFYRRLVEGTYNKIWKWAVFVAIGFSAGYTLAFVLALCFNCSPTRAYWKAFSVAWLAENHPYTCADTKIVGHAVTVCFSCIC
jgi:hypothetical protein